MIHLVYLLVLLLGYFLGFYVTLRMLKVELHLYKRSAILTAVIIGVQLISGLTVMAFGLDHLASILITLILSFFAIKHFLELKLWQTVLIPVLVTGTAHFIAAISLVTLLKLFGPIAVG